MIKLFVENVYTYYEGMDKDALFGIEKVMKYTDPNWVHKQRYLIEKYKQDTHDYRGKRRYEGLLVRSGQISLLDKRQKRFPSGLLNQVVMKLNLMHKPFEIIKEYKKPTVKIDIESEGFVLYDNQKKVFDKIKKTDFRCILDAATAFGKTVLGIYIIDYLKVPTLIVVPTVIIRDQWQEHFEQKFPDTTIVKYGSGRMVVDKNGDDGVLIATSQLMMAIFNNTAKTDSIRKRNIYLQKFIHRKVGLLVYDEVHLAGSDSGIIILNSVQCYYRIGLTGSFDSREDNKDLEYIALIGERATYVSPSDLIELKKAVELKIKFYPVESKMFGRSTPYPQVERIAIVNNHLRNELILDITYELIDEDRQVLILVDRIDHAKILSAIGDFEWTDSKDIERKRKFDEFRTGELSVLICTVKLAGIGFDMPPLSGLVLAGGGKSTNKFVQALGRVLRISKEKTNAIVIDFADNCKYLRNHSIERLRVYKAERLYEVDTKGTYLDRYNK